MQKNRKKTTPDFREDFPYICVLATLASLVGWLGENISTLIGSGKIDSRYHLLPFLSPYGLIVLLLYAALRNVDRATFFGKPLFVGETPQSKISSNLYCLFFITVATFLGELIVGNLWEHAFGVILWDYTNHAYCFTRYTCLLTTVLYGTGGYLFFRFGFAPLLHLIKKLPRKTAKIIGFTMGILLLLDTAIMCVHIAVFRRAPVYWTVRFR